MQRLSTSLKQYLVITTNYWAFTLSDGALRMLVVLYFHALGYSPLEVAMLFLFYEFFGVVTNLFGGWLGARWGLNRTMNIGLMLQVMALAALLLPERYLSVPWVMAAQALSGIAKDLNKMSAKSAIKTLVPAEAEGMLFKWVAVLTGSKNAMKGIGFFLGGALLTLFGFRTAIASMLAVLLCIWFFSLWYLRQDLGKAKNKPKFSQIFSKSAQVNLLSAARLFLFGARDIWFVVALPVALSVQFQWDHWRIGGFMAAWIIAYGIVQAQAPKVLGRQRGRVPDGSDALKWALLLSVIPGGIALFLQMDITNILGLLLGLILFGFVFAINSSLHSYLIVSYADADGVSLDVGFYYMANALGRLLGTVLSGWIYQHYGLEACLWWSSAFILLCSAISVFLPKNQAVH